MTIYQTTLGKEHYAQRLDGGVAIINAFDAIELGTGDTGISTADDRSDMLFKIANIDGAGSSLVQVSATYPKVNDLDVTNAGKGANVLSYKFIIPGGVTPFTASNIHLTNYSAGAPLADEPVGIVGNLFNLEKEPAIPLTIFINVRVI